MSTGRRATSIVALASLVTGCTALSPVYGQPAGSGSPAGSAPPPLEKMQEATIAVAWKLAEVGLWLVVIGFTIVVLTSLITALKLDIPKLIADAIARHEAAKVNDLGGGPSFPFTAMFQGLFSGLGELIKSPVGIGIALLVISAVLLLGESAITAGYTDTGAASPAPAASSAPAGSSAPSAAASADPSASTSPAAGSGAAGSVR